MDEPPSVPAPERPVASQFPQFMKDWELAKAGASASGKRILE